MALTLTEITIASSDRDTVESMIAEVAAAVAGAGGSLVEAQVDQDLSRIFFVADDADVDRLGAAVAGIGAEQTTPAPVRLVGATVEQVRQRGKGADYLVEWDLPSELGMETYLARKKDKAPLYANVPEVSFLRTYVREDMVKCLCFYDAPDADAVVRARQAVSTPIDRLRRLGSGTVGVTEGGRS